MATEKDSPEEKLDWVTLREAPDYRSFLQAYLDERSLRLSDLARAAGFGRGFPGDVISGRRRLTARSFLAFENALKLPPSGKKLFRNLVAREEPDLFPGLSRDQIEERVQSLRSKPWNRSRREVDIPETSQLDRILTDPKTLAIYAAVGKPGSGVSLDEIHQRSQVPAREIEPVLRELEKAGLLKHQDGRYEPLDVHLFLKTSAQSNALVLAFQEACRRASARVLQSSKSDRELFLTSAFCIKESRLPELKAALRSTLLKFVDDSINPEGDRVVHLIAGLHL